MHTIVAHNVNEALSEGLQWLKAAGVLAKSRNGDVLVSPVPVVTEYSHSKERVLFSPLRDANPFFHFFEALWMLAGQNDLAWLLYFNKGFGAYSDDGIGIWGAYGHRWRKWFGYDQLDLIVHDLSASPDSRRAVLAMWNAADAGEFYKDSIYTSDLHKAAEGGKDVPCNTHAYFDRRDGRLNMMVCCRSNDIYWGAYGANAVHFSFLLEYLAARIGIPVGVYRQLSYNFHLYTSVVPDIPALEALALNAEMNDLYAHEGVRTFPIMSVPNESWMRDLRAFMGDPAELRVYNDNFFNDVAYPMFRAWKRRKEGTSTGMAEAGLIKAADWRTACEGWIHRREVAKAKKAAAETKKAAAETK